MPFLSSKVFRRKKNDELPHSLSVSDNRSLSRTSPNTSAIDENQVIDEKGPLGLNLLYEPSEPLIDFVFVHGLGGGSRKTWSHSPSVASYYWPKEWLPKDASFKHVRIHSFGYDSDYAKRRNKRWTIQHFSQSLLGDLRTSPHLSQTDTPLVMIGHSLGGLVIKKAYMLAKHDPSLGTLSSRFQAIYFLGTPHRGSGWAKVLDHLLSLMSLSIPFVEELKRGTAVLEHINEEFRHYFDQFELVSFFEMNAMNILVSQIVENESGILGLPCEQQVPMAADHRSICKFKSKTDPNFLMIRNALALTVENICGKLAARKEALRQRELSDLLTVLGTLQHPDDDLELVRSSRLPGTCEWVAKKEGYAAWRDNTSEAPAILWIHGRPATGKSVLAGFIILDLQQRGLECSYYFFKQGDKAKSRLINCFRSLAYQMCRGNDDIRCAIGALRKEVMFEGENERNIWRKLFVSTIFKTGMALHYWVIDGLDECENAEVFIELLHEQLHIPSNLKILIISRNTMELKASFRDFDSHRYYDLGISTSDTTTDIKTVIDAKSNALTMANDAARNSMLEKVSKKSQGSFLWTILVLKELSNTYGEARINEVLDEVPLNMNSLYKRVLESMENATESNGRRVAQAILKWVSCASRPLRVAELGDALDLDLNDNHHSTEDMISKFCGQLVTVDKFGNVQIAHETIREYLTSKTSKSEFAVNKAEAHARMAEVCLLYLTSSEMKPVSLSRRGSRRLSTMYTKRSRKAFCGYASTSFSYHLANANFKATASETADARTAVLLDLLAIFLASNVLSWIESIAQSKVLTPILQAAKDLRTYLEVTNAPPTGKEIETITAATTDFVRVVARFSHALLNMPVAIYSLIPPFCPHSSTIHNACTKSKTTRLSLTGLSYDQWDERLTCMNLHNDTYTAVAYGDDFFAIGRTTGALTLYHAASCQEYKVLDHGEPIKHLIFGHNTDWLVSCGMKKVVVWDTRSGEAIFRLEAPYRAMALAFDRSILMVASARNFLRSWDLTNAEALREDRPLSLSDDNMGKPSRPQPSAVSISMGHLKLAMAYSGHAITIWDLEYDEYFGSCGKKLSNGKTTTHVVTSLAFNPNPDIPLLAAAYLDGELVLLDPFQGDELQSLRADCRALASSPNGRLLAGATHATILIYEFETLRLLYKVNSFGMEVKQVAFSGDNFHFADIRRSLCNIWEPTMLPRDSTGDNRSESSSTSIIEANISDNKVRISAMALHFQDEVLICGKDDGKVCLYDVRTGSLLRTIHQHNTQVHLVTWQICSESVLSVDTSNLVHAQKLTKKPREGWVSDRTLFQARLDGAKSVVQILPCETSNRLILATRESDHLWNTEGMQLAVRLHTQTPGVRLWIQHPRSQLHVMCIEGVTVRTFAWADWTEVSAIGLALDMHGLQLKSLGAYNAGQTHHILMEMSELDGSSRTRGLYHFDAMQLKNTNQLNTQNAVQKKTGEVDTATAMQTTAEESGEQEEDKEDPDNARSSSDEKSSVGVQSEVVVPLFGARVAALSCYISHIIHLTDIGKLIFLDTSSWVSSFDLRDFGPSPMVSSAAAAPSPPISYSRHFFVPLDWFSGVRDIACAATSQEVFLARNGEVAIIRGGLDYAEEVVVSAS